MKITILDGTPDSVHEALDRYLKNLVNALQTRHVVTRIALNALNIQFCTGCWSCWWKTPGECAIKDDSHEICRQVIHSDFVVLASPVIMGFPSALLKKTQDKLIP
ncbi:flavodoxin family protein, partial [candidate division KSB1 bacterium]|nr:flavodoxin family protein [candidate division KSB1 bacterium]